MKEAKIRQVVISSLNEGVTLLSYHENENMDYLLEKAMATMKQIKAGNDGKG